MLTLLEPPGAKSRHDAANRSAQHLLQQYGNLPDDELDFDDYDTNDLQPAEGGNFITRFLNQYLVGGSSSDEYSERWKKEFRQRPSWCDADLCLQQINLGKASGNRWALYSRSFVQKMLFSLGNFVHTNAWKVIFTVMVLFSFCCFGLQYVHIETDIVKLWVAKGGRLDEELNFLSSIQSSVNFNASDSMEIVRENGLGGGYQVVIQTPQHEGENALSGPAMLRHVDIMKQIATFAVNVKGSNWTLGDICFKPSPPLGEDELARSFEYIIERIVPCIWITPIDCFWEGGKALGPHPAVDRSLMGFLKMMKAIPDVEKISWSNFDPIEVVREVNSVLNIGTHATFFERVGMGHGYLDRPCMNPLDPECPVAAPNYYDVCPIMDKFLDYAEREGILGNISFPAPYETDIFDFFGRKKRDTEEIEKHPAIPLEELQLGQQPSAATVATTATTATTETTTTTQNVLALQRKERCKAKREGMMLWMQDNKDKWNDFLNEDELPHFPDYGEIMRQGCPGFAKEVLHWPKEMILGGARPSNGSMPLEWADALQSVFLVASPRDVFLRFKDRINMTKAEEAKFASARRVSVWNEEVAEEVITTWQRGFTKMMYNHPLNFDDEGNERRTIHPLASTSIADMLQEFCQFNYTIILVGYGLMLIYAMVTQLRTERGLPAANSSMGLALAGVLVVTFASVAGLGLATWFGIEFNAATTQIVPFLTLGIGVDNMFMLLHNYRDVVRLTNRNEMGTLMRETGMSILCTSINNILSFLAGTMLPIPALRSFCAQSTILLTFNFISILTFYPAIISIDLRRRKAGRRDLMCCLFADTREESYSMINKPKIQEKRTIGEPQSMVNLSSYLQEEVVDSEEPARYSLHGFIRNCYIPMLKKSWFRTSVLIGSCAMLMLAVWGVKEASIGLELSDVLPEHTAPAQFLRARDKYFSFYPMFAVIKGPHINYAEKQHHIENYRQSIASSAFVIKTATLQPSEKYWLGMMREWLVSLQTEFDRALEDGSFDEETGELIGNATDDALVARRLICSFGTNYDCSGRIGKVRLVDRVGTINHDGFYNYLTAWYTHENMMYYVSQASFYPTPPEMDKELNATFVPPAEPLSYSQIPFYLTGLTDTPTIVKMIKEIRETCDKFTAQGLPNFPQGIAFTFWEQYLHLNGNLMQAIAIIALAVFVVISVLLFNPWAALSILLILVAMTIELAGFLGWASVKMNPVSAVTLITAVGIGVEFTAHVVLAYLTALGSREKRTAAAVDRVFVPVIHGAFSTLLGILMLGFSEFEFVVKYFFVVMSALIVIGVINGLILLPVLLIICGPPEEVRSTNPKTAALGRLGLPPPRSGVEADDDEGVVLNLTPRRI